VTEQGQQGHVVKNSEESWRWRGLARRRF